MCSHQRLGDLQKLQVSAVFGRSRSESTGSINTNESKGGFPLVGGEGVSQNKARLNRITLMLCVRTRCTLFPIRAGQIRVRAAHLSEGEVYIFLGVESIKKTMKRIHSESEV